jgi:hypothetical protein
MDELVLPEGYWQDASFFYVNWDGNAITQTQVGGAAGGGGGGEARRLSSLDKMGKSGGTRRLLSVDENETTTESVGFTTTESVGSTTTTESINATTTESGSTTVPPSLPRITSKKFNSMLYIESCGEFYFSACDGGHKWENWTTCGEGTTGPMCANCIAGEDPFNPLYYRGGYGQCSPCGDNTVARIAFVATCITLVVTIALLCVHWRKTLKAIGHVAKRASVYRDRIRQSFYEKVFKVDKDVLKSLKSNFDMSDAELKKRDKNAMLFREPDNEITLFSQTHGLGVKFKILISLYQVTMAFVDFFNVEWPATFSLMMLNLTSLINFQFFNISFVGCLSQENYITTFASVTLLPIFLSILIFAAQKVWVLGGKSVKDFSLDDVERYIFYLLFLVYPTTSRVILSMFNCYQFADGSEVVVDSFTLSCNAAYKSTIWPIAAVFTFVYPLGVPIVLMYKLYVRIVRARTVRARSARTSLSSITCS